MTPMMKQYYEIKKSHQDCILFFRLGDFYEMFEDDAIEACKILGIVLTARSKGENKIPMCGIPFHAAPNYIAKLTRAGKKVAICEQLTDASLPGIVQRGVVKIITPGTTLDEQILDQKTSSYICSIDKVANSFFFVIADISTGEFRFTNCENFGLLVTEIEKNKPRELIYKSNGLVSTKEIDQIKRHFSETYCFEFEEIDNDILNYFDFCLIEYKEFQNKKEAESSIKLLLSYLRRTQKNNLNHLNNLRFYDSRDFMCLDEATVKNLELLQNSRENIVHGSLLGILDKTTTSFGGRMLKKVIIQPLMSLDKIEKRLNIIDFFLTNQNLLLDLRSILKEINDIERIIGRLSLNSGNARDLRGIYNSYQAIKKVKKILTEINQKELNVIANQIDTIDLVIDNIGRAIIEDAPHSIKEGGIIADGYNVELDYLKNISKDGKLVIQSIQEREIKRTGIGSLKVKYNRVFGYYIEISNSNLKDVPEDYTRKQTLANAERFSTPELKEYEEKILGAEEKIGELELKIFTEIKQTILESTIKIQECARQLSIIDVMSTLALVSWENNYTRPTMHDGQDLMLIESRHPVIEKLNPIEQFIPNDLDLSDTEKLMLITGPNMGGKSTYLRQVALITLMAHLGMYVPAKSAKIPLVDRIFTRVGASDNLVRGQSTFWVEMEETALILKNATEKSLIILDEIGRGTSTFDGVSIAWGIVEYLHNSIKAKTLFASHYHELIALASKLEFAVNYSVSVIENSEKGVVFLYKIVKGGINKSYGIEVAKLAGLPSEVTNRAKEILKDLEKEVLGNENLNNDIIPLQERQTFNLKFEPNPLLEQIKNIDLNNLTPVQAFQKLNEFKTSLNE